MYQYFNIMGSDDELKKALMVWFSVGRELERAQVATFPAQIGRGYPGLESLDQGSPSLLSRSGAESDGRVWRPGMPDGSYSTRGCGTRMG